MTMMNLESAANYYMNTASDSLQPYHVTQNSENKFKKKASCSFRPVESQYQVFHTAEKERPSN